ncbi:hypothetical protein M427DRAFT_54153 [Gonapodya prolifera JEL478]|uniref:Uncharacterized protein n=1 Tax=Gonapodya prolifera (strain JEL478) TaxID=1344416 RepID=A0A139AMB8_GONPJ|nr:hypothetical protein M427DRAFT_54153 [Gonapodya prolifera JEL478]|eukprot:KXS17910.1 hypothetical protein M427DRAFT_54153 [Gonapodya prolifera JEL478]
MMEFGEKLDNLVDALVVGHLRHGTEDMKKFKFTMDDIKICLQNDLNELSSSTKQMRQELAALVNITTDSLTLMKEVEQYLQKHQVESTKKSLERFNALKDELDTGLAVIIHRLGEAPEIRVTEAVERMRKDLYPDLSRWTSTKIEFKIACIALRTFAKVVALDLSSKRLGDEEIKDLVEAIVNNQRWRIQRLYLSGKCTRMGPIR